MALQSSYKGRLDNAGIILAGICLIHCAAGLWFLFGMASIGASLGASLLSPIFHEFGLLLAGGIALIALGHGALRHGRYLPLSLGSLGIGIMAGGLANHDVTEFFFTFIGVALLAYAHFNNFRLMRQCSATKLDSSAALG